MARPPLAADDPRHGTVNGYRNLECRCPACRSAHTAASLAARDTRDPTNQPHGDESTYFNYKCRCEACKAEHAIREKERRANRRARAAVTSGR